MRLLLRSALLGLLFSSVAAFAAELPYTAEPALDLKFDQPLGIVSAPDETNRLFILEKTGRVVVVPDLARPARRVFLDLRERIGSIDSEQGLLALAFHPDFKRNRFFYVWYTSCLEVGGRTVREDRLSRFTVSAADPNVADPASELRMISQTDQAANHNGGELLFGRDGYLYLSLGDEGAGDDKFRNSQRIDHDFFAGIIRIDVDRKPGNLAPHPHPAVHAGTYAIPADNPFVGAKEFNGAPVVPARVRTEFWAVGLRNVWRMSFDAATGALWAADVGQRLHEEVDLIVRGGNYGWSYREGASAFDRGLKNPPAAAKFIAPIWDYPHSQGLSITGGFVYHGTRCPELEGKYIFGDYVFGHIWALTPDGDKPVGPERVQSIARGQTIVSFGADPRNGDVLFASLTAGKIFRLVPNPAAKK
jgi:glucose/arabinose dehydrogenase